MLKEGVFVGHQADSATLGDGCGQTHDCVQGTVLCDVCTAFYKRIAERDPRRIPYGIEIRTIILPDPEPELEPAPRRRATKKE